jgi:hypothetical protein
MKRLTLAKLTRPRYPIVRLLTVVVIIAMLAVVVAAPALADGGNGGVGAALSGIVKAIVDIIKSLCAGLGVLGLSIWGIGKVARPVFPQLASMTQGYITDLMIGIAVVFVASTVVESLVSTIGGGAGG